MFYRAHIARPADVPPLGQRGAETLADRKAPDQSTIRTLPLNRTCLTLNCSQIFEEGQKEDESGKQGVQQEPDR